MSRRKFCPARLLAIWLATGTSIVGFAGHAQAEGASAPATTPAAPTAAAPAAPATTTTTTTAAPAAPAATTTTTTAAPAAPAATTTTTTAAPAAPAATTTTTTAAPAAPVATTTTTTTAAPAAPVATTTTAAPAAPATTTTAAPAAPATTTTATPATTPAATTTEAAGAAPSTPATTATTTTTTTTAPKKDDTNYSLTLLNAAHSESITICEYLGYDKSDEIRYNHPPLAHYKIVKILKGPPLNRALPVRYEFHLPTEKTPPHGWTFTDKAMPEKGSQWIIFIEHAVPKTGMFETYQACYGRQPASEDNLNAVYQILSDQGIRQ